MAELAGRGYRTFQAPSVLFMRQYMVTALEVHFERLRQADTNISKVRRVKQFCYCLLNVVCDVYLSNGFTGRGWDEPESAPGNRYIERRLLCLVDRRR